MLFEKFTDLIRSLSLVSSFFLNNTARPFYKENLYWLLRGNIRITISPELHFYIHCVSCKEVWLRLGLFIGKLESWINYLWHIKWSIVGYLYFHWAWIMNNECHVLDFMIISMIIKGIAIYEHWKCMIVLRVRVNRLYIPYSLAVM